MSLEIRATYEGGVLKPSEPLPFHEHEQVIVSVKARESRMRKCAGLIPWSGDPDVLRKIAEDPEFGVLESS